MIKIGGNEKFALREGWLTKGLKLVKDSDSNPFLDEDAIVKFGMGPNMVKALRYYLKTSDMIIEKKDQCTLNSENGIDVLIKEDPYFEDDFCYFIFHYLIVSNNKNKTIFSFLFNNIEEEIFDKEKIKDTVKKIASISNERINDKTLDNDISIVLNMYAKEKIKDIEDTYVSPLINLKLIKRIDSNYYKKISENTKCLPANLVYFSIVNCMRNGEEAISLNDLANRENSPIKAFNLNRDQINLYIDLLRKKGMLRFESTAGLNMIYPIKTITLKDVIKEHYNKCR